MTRDHNAFHTRTSFLAVLALSATMVLAGCHDLTGTDALSYDEARDSLVTALEPEEDSPVRMGVIEPGNPENVSTGRLDVTVLLFDSSTDTGIEDAGITIDGYMPMHGHGTSPERDPEHEANGVYSGYTTLSMGGMWQVHLNVTLANGSGLAFTLPVHAMEEGGMDHGMDHDM